MIEVRFHGRGGQGAKAASRILGRSGFVAGLYAQDFPLFGAERRGAPVVAFTRLGKERIDQRGYIEIPDIVIVIDESLLDEVPAQIFHGVRAATPVVINAATIDLGHYRPALSACTMIALNLTSIARRHLGDNVFFSAVAAGAAAKLVTELTADALAEAVRSELHEFGLSPDLIEKNVLAASEAFALAPTQLPVGEPAEPTEEKISIESVPYLSSVEFIAPTIRHRGSAALRDTGSWRIERPEIALQQCKRCFLCYLYCPDAAIHLDGDNFPHVDYDHCKGCMICYEECPTDAIVRRVEL